MGIRQALAGYNISLGEFRAKSKERNKDYFLNPSRYYVKPFRISDDLYYVGDARCCVHLLDTHDGLILFDSGISHTVHMLIQSIWELGFNPADVKMILHSHAHYDHFGAANDFKGLFKTLNCLSRKETESIRENPERTLLSYSPCPWARMFYVDREIEDGEVICLGDKAIHCVTVPSHTPGTLAFFFDTSDRGEEHHVGYFGGIGFLSVYKEFLEEYDLPKNSRELFLESLQKVRGENVDIVLGNHPSQNSTLEKMKLLLNNSTVNPFIDPDEWVDFIDYTSEALKRFVEAGF